MRTKSLRIPSRREVLDDAVAGAPAGEAGRDDRRLEALERTRDVDPLAAGAGEAGARAMPVAELEVRDRQRPVDCRIEGDGDDQPDYGDYRAQLLRQSGGRGGRVVRVDHRARGRRKRARRTGRERRREILEPAALRADAGQEQHRARHESTRVREHLGMRRADDRLDPPCVHALGDVVPERPAVAEWDVLEIGAAGIRGLDDREDPEPFAREERLERVHPEVRVDGDRVGERRERRRVRAHGRGDVAALAVDEDEETRATRVVADVAKRGPARRLRTPRRKRFAA